MESNETSIIINKTNNMTKEELIIIVNDAQQKYMILDEAHSNLGTLIDKISQMIKDPNFSDTINIDELVAVYTPIYIANLTANEQALDAFGTDGLN